ncbi:MAG: type I-B CRISPR-associated protein Cas7/Csh2 [Syntrophomonadaceae bacterium]|nr:type I-B CRISPR-associated protein Cas7/Csh2 [Syntrophomonadaceae bacterium]
MNRSELLFLYDITDANPNGDPMDENKPRLDEETGINLVTDVRLKRTIRDYLHENKGYEIFVREIRDEKDNLQDAKLRAEDFLYDEPGNKLNKEKMTVAEMKTIISKNVLNECIDVRLFGATIPIEKKKGEAGSLTYTGPAQFKMGRSMHAVNMMHIKGTGAFASGKEKSQATFREEYFLSYSLINFYGIINENAAVHTDLREEDVDLLLEAMWKGTKSLISRSKAGQIPRVLFRVAYKEKDYHIGELDKYIALKKHDDSVRDEELRDISQVQIDVTALLAKLSAHRDKIDKVEYALDSRVTLVNKGSAYNPAEAAEGVQFIALPFNS